MDPRRLLIFRDVVREGSISAAARHLGWTQPAVSQHLRALEREARCTLLLRGAGGVTPTEAGEALMVRADAVAAQLHMAVEELGALASLSRGRVRLAAYPSAAATIVPDALARLRANHPGIDVALVEAEPPEAIGLLSRGDVDLALVFGYEPEPDGLAELEWHPLGAEPVHLVVPASHPVASDGGATLADMAAEDWVVGCERCRAHALQRCAEAGFQPSVRHVTDDYIVAQRLVAAGLGVTLLPHSALVAYRDPGVRVVGEYGTRRFGVAYRRGAQTVPATAALLAELGLMNEVDTAADLA